MAESISIIVSGKQRAMPVVMPMIMPYEVPVRTYPYWTYPDYQITSISVGILSGVMSMGANC